MKILLVSVNARFVHTNLAIRYLSTKVEHDHAVLLKEFTINHHDHEILEQIYRENADVVAFSCYIWNIELILKVVTSLKKVNPETIILLGGPEVSYDAEVIMKSNDAIDFIISGYGEASFAALMEALDDHGDYTKIPGLAYRIKGSVYSNKPALQGGDTFLARAYEESNELEKEKIYYYETSRGCPYHCQFCLSGNNNILETLPLQQVYDDLLIFMNQQVKQVKFVDRTFNINQQRTLAIWKFLKDHDNGITNFHFEISAAALTKDMINFLATVPEGLFQFEIGVQTTNHDTLISIQRISNQEEDFRKITTIQKLGTIHLHVDLIAGLPHEDFFSFRKSFNEVFQLKANMLQLGFLKLLKGSGLRDKVFEYEFVFQDDPPYEILSNHVMEFGELLQLKGIEDMLERYWNSGKFRNTITLFIRQNCMEPFMFFQELAEYWQLRNPEGKKIGQRIMVDYLRDFMISQMPQDHAFIDGVIAFDLAAAGQQGELTKSRYPQETVDAKKRVHELLHNQPFISHFFPDMHDQPAKKMLPYIYSMVMPPGFKLDKAGKLDYDLYSDKEPILVFIYPRKNKQRIQKTIIINVEEVIL